MGKISAAKKKERRKDFQKVKFKVGKKLPKNLNETRATFKAKTLILKKQFDTEKDGPVSHRNLSWRDLLAHLSHHNQSIKLDAIHSLKEMITSNQDIIKLDLNNFLENICPLFADRDYKVREAGMQLFKTFILLPDSAQKRNSLEPFYSLLNVHLSCAMTHISETVQYDSLKLLDIMIDSMPELVRTNAYTIFENFIDQISKASLKGNKRTLKNDPYKMTSTQTWRSKVLNRLYKMLQIVSEKSDKTGQANVSMNMFNFDDDKEWRILPSKAKSILVNIDQNRECSIITYPNEYNKIHSLKICKRLSARKNLTEINEFFEHYFKIIAPLLTDCWIEAKPENKNIIESYESLSIMNSVLSIFNLLLENLEHDLTTLSKSIRSSSDANHLKHIETLFLNHFPYFLAENFEYTDSKKINHQISANTINLLLCKFCASSLLKLSEDKLLEIFKYSLDSLVINKNSYGVSNHKLEVNELVTVLNLSETIFNNFSNIDITKPFLIALTKYFDAANKFSNNKWIVFEFICKQFYENQNLKDFNSIFVAFFKKIFTYCIAYEKENKEKLEALIDWIRKLIIRKEKLQTGILSILENEYINMLNNLDFESKEVPESCKKKLLELIYWLPRINRFLFTKLSILILKKNLSIVNTNQILSILKERLEKNDSSFDHSDYYMFLTSLFNGASGFDLMNNNTQIQRNESFTLDYVKFRQHAKLCKHLEEFILSHKNSNVIIDLLISASVPEFLKLESITGRTLYGSLCLVSHFQDMNPTSSNYGALIKWLTNAQLWIINMIQTIQTNQLGTREQVEQNLICFNELLNKTHEIYAKNPIFLNNLIQYLITITQMSNNPDNIRKMIIVINNFLMKFGSGVKPSKDYLFNVYTTYQSLNERNYIWWHEYSNLLKTL